MKVYMDEAGYTGEDLINPAQPIFTLASTILDNDECQAIYRDVFRGVKAKELKHVALARKSSGQQRVIDFLKAIRDRQDKIGVYITHKKFVLITLLVDWWVEPSMHRHGFDLYNRGGHIALSNLSYVVLHNVGSPSFSRELLQKFQAMMRERTPELYHEFWEFVRTSHAVAHPLVKEVLGYFIVGEMDLGIAHLRSLPQRALDIAMTVAATSLQNWRAKHEGPFEIIHDKSSGMAKEKWLWDQLVSSEQEPAVLGLGDHQWIFPANVTSTTFEDSKNTLQLQFADLLAGCMARFIASRIDKSRRCDYTDKLEEAGIPYLAIGGI